MFQKSEVTLKQERIAYLENQVKDYQQSLLEVSDKLTEGAKFQAEAETLRERVMILETEIRESLQEAEAR